MTGSWGFCRAEGNLACKIPTVDLFSALLKLTNSNRCCNLYVDFLSRSFPTPEF